MDVESLAKELILKNMTPEQQLAVLDSVRSSVAQAKEAQKRKIGENVDLVVQALKKIEADIRARYDEVGNKIEKRVASIKDGRDGINGKDGRDGKNGRDGAQGPQGLRGESGRDGRDGVDGVDGVSVTSARIDFDGSLIISLSSGVELNVGEVVAPELAERIKVVSSNGGGTSQSVLDTLTSLQNQINAMTGGLDYQGTWNASTNSPALASGVGTTNYYYIVGTSGSTNLDGITDWVVGDWVIFNGTVWQKIDQTNLVVSVNGQTGAVTLTSTNISEGTNLYYTDARARGALSAGTGISYNSSTGQITNSSPDQTVALTAGTGISTSGTYPNFTITNSSPDQTVSLTGGGTTSISGTYPNFTVTSNDQYTGTVTSVTGTSPVASSGGNTPAISLESGYGDTQNPFASKTANYFLAAPNGSSGAPTFRAIVAADIPTLNQNTTGTASNVTDTVAIANGGTGQTTATAAFNALAPSQTSNSGKYLTTDGTNTSWATVSSGGFPAGTAMLFAQTSAPTGWTKSTTHNNKALRVVSGTASSGGSVAFTTAFASKSVSGSIANTTATGSISTSTSVSLSSGGSVNSYTLSTSEIPSHTHTFNYASGGGSGLPNANFGGFSGTVTTNGTGGGGGHSHGFTNPSYSASSSSTFTGTAHNHTFTGTAIDLSVQYVDVIIATKD